MAWKWHWNPIGMSCNGSRAVPEQFQSSFKDTKMKITAKMKWIKVKSNQLNWKWHENGIEIPLECHVTVPEQFQSSFKDTKMKTTQKWNELKLNQINSIENGSKMRHRNAAGMSCNGSRAVPRTPKWKQPKNEMNSS